MNLKTLLFLLGLMLLNTFKAQAEKVTIWSENWSSASEDISVLVKDITNDDATYSVSSTDVRLYNTTISAGGSSGAPELFIIKDGGSFTATISSLKGCTGDLTLTFYSNKDLTISSSTKGVTVSKVKSSGKKYTYSIRNAVDGFKISFKQTNKSENARLDDILLTGIRQVEPTFDVSDQSISYGSTYTLDTSDFLSGAVTLTSSNPAVATVDDLTLTSVAAGTTTITVSTAETEDYEAGEKTFTLTVTAPEGQSTSAGTEVTTTSVSVTNGYATYCYLYPLNLDGIVGAKAYKVSGVDVENGVVNLTQITGSIKGGVPFILKADGADGDYSIPLAESSSVVPDDNVLVGTLVPTFVAQTTDDDTNFAYSKKNGCFVKINTSGNTVPANRAYLPINLSGASSVKSFALAFDDAETGVQTVYSEKTRNSNDVFNVMGQRVNPSVKGLVIIDGKKTIVK